MAEAEIVSRIMSCGRDGVERALLAGQASQEDFLSLLSPAAAGMIEAMRSRAATLKAMNFGRTVRLYAPIYLSSHCINNCAYCGFRAGNGGGRRRLSMDEAIAEASILKSWGMDSLLLVSGEDPKSVSVDYLETLASELRKDFSYLAIEVYPMGEASYRRLFNAGVHGLTIYQETYDRELYLELHPSGPKRDYSARLAASEAGAAAGFHNVAIGALLGLHDWRSEAVSMAAHALWLRKRCWRSKVQFAFPRITPMKGGFEAPHPVGEKELEQMMLAFRIMFPQSDILLSTREGHEFRMRAAATCASHLSAGSRVAPGAYAADGDEAPLGQFTVVDEHSTENVCKSLQSIGIEPVFKDWDASIGGAA